MEDKKTQQTFHNVLGFSFKKRSKCIFGTVTETTVEDTTIQQTVHNILGFSLSEAIKVDILTKMTSGDKTTQQTFQYILGFSPTIMTTSPQKSSNPAQQAPNIYKIQKNVIYYDTDNTMQIFREIPFFRPQNDT